MISDARTPRGEIARKWYGACRAIVWPTQRDRVAIGHRTSQPERKYASGSRNITARPKPTARHSSAQASLRITALLPRGPESNDVSVASERLRRSMLERQRRYVAAAQGTASG